MEEKLMEELVTKPISFPLLMLKILDKYALETNKSRALVVREACSEFIKNHNLNVGV